MYFSILLSNEIQNLYIQYYIIIIYIALCNFFICGISEISEVVAKSTSQTFLTLFTFSVISRTMVSVIAKNLKDRRQHKGNPGSIRNLWIREGGFADLLVVMHGSHYCRMRIQLMWNGSNWPRLWKLKDFTTFVKSFLYFF